MARAIALAPIESLGGGLLNAPLGPLFRAEVIDARRQRVEGEIVLVQSTGTHLLVLLLFALIGVCAVALGLGSYTRSEVARGILVTASSSAKITATRPGQVTELAVTEGTLVRAGQRLVTIRSEQKDELGGSSIEDGLTAIDAQRRLTGEQIRLAGTRATSERARVSATLAGLRQQQSDLAAQITLQEESVSSTRDMLERVESLVAKGFISRIEVERRRQAHIAARQELARLRQQSNAASAEALRTAAELGRVGADAGREVVSARASAETLVQQQARLRGERAYTLVAPISGRVTAVQTGIGRSVDPAVPLMEIVPDASSLTAQLYAPTRAIGFVRPGQEVRLLYDAFPYQRFGSFVGRVTTVSRTVIDPRQLAAPFKFEEPVYRIEVAPLRQSVEAYGERFPLQPGMTLTANIVLDRRSFLDWLLAPLHAVTNRNG